MRKINAIINEYVAKKVAKKVAKEQRKKMISEFESYILSQMLVTNKTRKELIDEIVKSVN